MKKRELTAQVRSAGVAPIDYETLAHFRYELREFLAFSEQAAGRMHLTANQHQALLTLKASGPNETLSIGQLAKRLVLKHHSAVGLTNRLVARRLVVRTRDFSDRRRICIQLTPKSRNILAHVSKAHLSELRLRAPRLISLLSRLRKVGLPG